MTTPPLSEDDRGRAKRRGMERYDVVFDEANDYHETVMTLLAFSALLCYDGRTRRPDSHFGFGRRMDTSAANPVSPTTAVTPDCVVQRSRDYGIAAEVKKQIGKDQLRWAPHAAQLRKYDDALTGWWTDDEQIAASDALLLMHISRTSAFRKFLDRTRAADADAVGPHSALVEFNRSDERQPYIFFRIAWGELRDAALQARLDDGVPVPMQAVLRSYPQVQFYDAKPPLEDFMTTLWIDWLSSFDPANPKIAVVVSELTDEMQRAYGSQLLEVDARSKEFPKVQWVREAMDTFVRLGLAESAGDGERFNVLYKIFPKEPDLLQRFCEMTAKLKEERVSKAQLTLFEPASPPAAALPAAPAVLLGLSAGPSAGPAVADAAALADGAALADAAAPAPRRDEGRDAPR